MSSQNLQHPVVHPRSDERKVAVAYDCPCVGREVEFSWTELDDETIRTAASTHLVRCSCSHRGTAGCPVALAATNEVLEWTRCPRLQRLQSKIREFSVAGSLD